MSIYIINGGIFNTSTTCILRSPDYVESVFECINKYYGNYKLALKKSEGLTMLIKNDITMYKLFGSVNDTDFNNIMNKVFESYYNIPDFEDKTFEANGKEEIFGFKRIEGINCWFISKSAACIKKIITQMIKDKELQKGTFKKYPFTVKPKKSVAKSSIQIQNSDDEEEKPKDEKPKRIIKKSVKPKKEEKKEEEESDEDNGIQKPEPKVEIKTSTSKSSRSEKSERSERSEKDKKELKKPSRSPSVKLEKSKSKTKTKSSSSSSIKEEEIEKPQKVGIKVQKITEKSGSLSDSENSDSEIPEENMDYINNQIDNIVSSQSEEEAQEYNSNSDKSEGESVMSSEEDE